MTVPTPVPTVCVCDTEPISIEGVRRLLEADGSMLMAGAESSLAAGMEMVRRDSPSVLLIDRDLGIHGVIDWVRALREHGRFPSPVIWGSTLSQLEATRLIQAGAVGVIRKTAPLTVLLECLRAAMVGNTWVEGDLMIRAADGAARRRSTLTARELQVVELVEQGMRNREIASLLGIQTGTVKIHLKHIFEKTGIHGRYGLALSGLKQRGYLSLPPTI